MLVADKSGQKWFGGSVNSIFQTALSLKKSSAHPVNKVSVVPSSSLFSDPINTAGEYRNITDRLAETLEDAWIENWFSDAEDIKGPGCRSQQAKRALLPSVFCYFLCLFII